MEMKTFFFRDRHNFGRIIAKLETEWKCRPFFLEITIFLREKVKDGSKDPFFLENTNFWKFLPQAPEFEYPPLIMKINTFRDYYNAARK